MYMSEHISTQIEGTRDSAVTPRQARGVGALTDRELEILELLGRGSSRADVAEKLKLSVKTVEAHRSNMKSKLGLKSSHELTRYAMRWIER